MAKKPGIEGIRALIAERRERLIVLEAERHTIESELTGLELALRAMTPPAGAAPARDKGDQVKSFTSQVTEAIVAVLQEERPLHRAVILRRVLERDPTIVIEAENQLHYFGTFLSNAKETVPVKGRRGYWTLADAPEAAAPKSC